MATSSNSKATSENDISRYVKQGSNKLIYIAIAVVILVTVIAMTGVYFEYW